MKPPVNSIENASPLEELVIVFIDVDTQAGKRGPYGLGLLFLSRNPAVFKAKIAGR